ncbi:MAG: beta-lactamase family protein [Bacteroidetes bacterium]|nr:beta-lactamase family protein [Bacteroidota bacterium]
MSGCLNIHRLALCAILLLSGTYAHAQDVDPVTARHLQGILDSIRVADGIQGVAVGLHDPLRGEWSGVGGESHAGTPISADMVFGIASNTKTFVAVLLLRLQEEGLLSLDDPVATWLPPIDGVDSTIQIRQLLQHTSGIGDYASQPWYRDSIRADPQRHWRAEEILAMIGPPDFKPGTSWKYSNANYYLAGLIAEAATGHPVAALLRTHILDPLGLDTTFLGAAEAPRGVIAHPWTAYADISAMPRRSLLSGAWTAGAMYSTSGEMVRWYRGLMEGEIIDAASLAQMTEFSGPVGYGLGLFQRRVSGRTVWGHSGSIIGYRSQMLYDVASGIVISVLVNQNTERICTHCISDALLSALIEEVTGVDGIATAAPATVTLHPAAPNPVRDRMMVRFDISHPGAVQLELRDLPGRRVRTLCDGWKEAGSHRVDFRSADLSRGVYLLLLRQGTETRFRSIIVY